MAHKYGSFTSRTKARKRAADVLFEADQKKLLGNERQILRLLEDRKSVTAAPSPLPEYSAVLVTGVAADFHQIDALLKKYARGAGLDRVPAVDVAVMRVAVWELLRNQDEVPPITAIDEAVAIVKDFSTDESPSYVNAVLDAVRKDIEESVRLGDTEVPNVGTEQATADIELDERVQEELDELLGEY